MYLYILSAIPHASNTTAGVAIRVMCDPARDGTEQQIYFICNSGIDTSANSPHLSIGSLLQLVHSYNLYGGQMTVI